MLTVSSRRSRLAVACLRAAAARVHAAAAVLFLSTSRGSTTAACSFRAAAWVHAAAANSHLLRPAAPPPSLLLLPMPLLALTTASSSLVPEALGAAGARDRGLFCWVRRREVQSTLMEAATCALADADSAYLSTAPSRRREGRLTWMEAAARRWSDMDYAFSGGDLCRRKSTPSRSTDMVG